MEGTKCTVVTCSAAITSARYAGSRCPSGRATTSRDRDHTVVVDVDDLEPATTYWYRFELGGHRSPVGQPGAFGGTANRRTRRRGIPRVT